jgi:MFS family permease
LNTEAGELTAVRRKVDLRVLPFLLLCYAFAYLDRVNVGFAKLQLQADIQMSDAAFGIGAGIFFVGYVLFEIPSNLLLERIGARKTFSRIMILWGCTCAAMACVESSHGFYVMRFLLGVFEAGFGPGIVFYLTRWYSPAMLARPLAIVLLAGPVGGALGGPISAAIMAHFDGRAGLAGWQWLFLVEGLPCAALGLALPFCLAHTPEQPDLLRAELQRETPASGEFAAVLANPRTYGLAAGYFCLISGMYGMSFWLPTLLKDMGAGDLADVGFYAAVPYAAAVVCMLSAAASSDHFGERRRHSAGLAVLSSVMLVGAIMLAGTWSLWFGAIVLSTGLLWASYSMFWAAACDTLRPGAAAGGTALINSIGLLGGFASPAFFGWIRQATGSLELGLWALAAMLLLAGALILTFGRAGSEVPPAERLPAIPDKR